MLQAPCLNMKLFLAKQHITCPLSYQNLIKTQSRCTKTTHQASETVMMPEPINGSNPSSKIKKEQNKKKETRNRHKINVSILKIWKQLKKVTSLGLSN
jgi:hypothetical protein